MYLKSLLIALLTSMDYCRFDLLKKLRCSLVSAWQEQAINREFESERVEHALQNIETKPDILELHRLSVLPCDQRQNADESFTRRKAASNEDVGGAWGEFGCFNNYGNSELPTDNSSEPSYSPSRHIPVRLCPDITSSQNSTFDALTPVMTETEARQCIRDLKDLGISLRAKLLDLDLRQG